MTFTGLIGRICMFPLRAIIATCVALRIHPNILTLRRRAHQRRGRRARSAHGRFVLAGVIMIVANIFDFIDGKVAHRARAAVSEFGAFWDSMHRPLLGHRAVHRPDLPLLEARPHRLRDGRRARDDVRDHDELHARARRVAHREVQGRLHGAARAHRAVHDRRVHQPHGGRAVGDPGAVDLHRRRPDHPHLPRAARARARRSHEARRHAARRASSGTRSSGPTSAPPGSTT